MRGYRGGYLPTERRSIEQGLREGEVLGVVSTNALELGVDIGRLDVAVLAGYPGSIAGAWQQLGRAGRRAGTSVGVVIASGAPVDQYVVHHPEFLLGSRPEERASTPTTCTSSRRTGPPHSSCRSSPGRCSDRRRSTTSWHSSRRKHVRQAAGDGRWY